MKIKLNAQLVGVNGVKPLINPETKSPMTLKDVCINSILTPIQGDKEKQKFEKWELYKKVRDCKSAEIDLKTEEVVIIKQAIGEIQPPLIMGQAFELIEGIKMINKDK